MIALYQNDTSIQPGNGYPMGLLRRAMKAT